MRPVGASGGPGDSVSNGRRRRARLWINLGWGLVQVAIVALLLFAGALLGAYVGLDLLIPVFGWQTVDGAVAIGLTVGILLAVVICHKSREWLHRLQVRQLRASGARVEATVVSVNRVIAYNPRGPNLARYTLIVRWTDPTTYAAREDERQYKFWGGSSPRFESACTGTVPVICDPRHPGRIAIDLPFVPTMADFFLWRVGPRGSRTPW